MLRRQHYARVIMRCRIARRIVGCHGGECGTTAALDVVECGAFIWMRWLKVSNIYTRNIQAIEWTQFERLEGVIL